MMIIINNMSCIQYT